MARARSGSSRYTPPMNVHQIGVQQLLAYCGRHMPAHQPSLFPKDKNADPVIYYSGELELLQRPAVAVIGSRDVSADGVARATRIAKLLSGQGVTIVSGLAKGVDTAAHKGAIEADGDTVAVIGTPIDKAYPAENAALQAEIYRKHLLISQFAPGTRTFPSDFPKRNRLMAAITDASIIVEASDTSGSLHQAAECVRLGKWLFIMKSVIEDPRLTWPQKFLKEPMVRELATADDVLKVIRT